MRPLWLYDRRSSTREEPALYQLNRSLIEDMIDMEAI